jgi:hypothetical protein
MSNPEWKIGVQSKYMMSAPADNNKPKAKGFAENVTALLLALNVNDKKK